MKTIDNNQLVSICCFTACIIYLLLLRLATNQHAVLHRRSKFI